MIDLSCIDKTYARIAVKAVDDLSVTVRKGRFLDSSARTGLARPQRSN